MAPSGTASDALTELARCSRGPMHPWRRRASGSKAAEGTPLISRHEHEQIVRPLLLHELRVAVRPLHGRVRLAGTMALDGLDPRIDQARVARCTRSAEERLRSGTTRTSSRCGPALAPVLRTVSVSRMAPGSGGIRGHSHRPRHARPDSSPRNRPHHRRTHHGKTAGLDATVRSTPLQMGGGRTRLPKAEGLLRQHLEPDAMSSDAAGLTRPVGALRRLDKSTPHRLIGRSRGRGSSSSRRSRQESPTTRVRCQ